MTPFRILEVEVALASNKPEKTQVIKIGEEVRYLHIKKFDGYHILANGYWSGGKFYIEEVYKIYEDIIRRHNDINLIQILEDLYYEVGIEVRIGGRSTRFLINSDLIIGLPPLPIEVHRDRITEYMEVKNQEIGVSEYESTNFNIRFKIDRGNYVDFMRILLLYALNYQKYIAYLNRR